MMTINYDTYVSIRTVQVHRNGLNEQNYIQTKRYWPFITIARASEKCILFV